jgi:integrase
MPRARGSGSIYKQKNSAVWWIKYYRDGKPIRESAKTPDEQKAEKFLRQRLGEIAAGNFAGPAVERIKVAELADDFLRDYRINERKSLDDAQARWDLHLEPFFGSMRASQVTSEHIKRYVDQRQHEKAKNATINRELAALKRMYHIGHRATPPKVHRIPAFPHLQENNIRTGFLEDGQFEKLIAACPELWFRALVEVGRTYGWRVSELLSMRVRQIDLLARTIRLEPGTTKNRDGREVTMTRNVHGLLSACAEGKKAEDHVFTRPDDSTVRVFRKVWKKAARAAGVPALLFHDLRRTAARNLRRAGVAEGIIMKIGGWRTRSVFERYAIVSQSDIVDALTKLENQNGHVLGHSEQKTEESAESPVVQ